MADPVILDLLSEIGNSKKQPYVSITTNGTLLAGEVLKVLKKIKRMDINISIDGINEIYEMIRGYRFNKLISNIKLLRYEMSHIDISLTFTTTSLNVRHVPEMLYYAEDLDRAINLSHVDFGLILEGSETPFSLSFLTGEEKSFLKTFLKKEIEPQFYEDKFRCVGDILDRIDSKVLDPADWEKGFLRRRRTFEYFLTKRRADKSLKYLQMKKIPFLQLEGGEEF